MRRLNRNRSKNLVNLKWKVDIRIKKLEVDPMIKA